MKPVRLARVTQPFGDPGNYASRADEHGPRGHHTGVDYGYIRIRGRHYGIQGAKVRATRRGRVIISGYDRDWGRWVAIRSEEGEHSVTHFYCHMRSRKVRRGQIVRRGQFIGRVGNTGNSTGPHLHYQENWGPNYDYHAHRKPRFNKRR
jgi:murein DD-endopeptidase MepM/ murein hydrolase activator NlpD